VQHLPLCKIKTRDMNTLSDYLIIIEESLFWRSTLNLVLQLWVEGIRQFVLLSFCNSIRHSLTLLEKVLLEVSRKLVSLREVSKCEQISNSIDPSRNFFVLALILSWAPHPSFFNPTVYYCTLCSFLASCNLLN